jgi:hypothetical protein
MTVPGLDGRVDLAVAETSNPAQVKIIAGYKDSAILDIHWLNEHRLLYRVADFEADASLIWGGLFAVEFQLPQAAPAPAAPPASASPPGPGRSAP